MRYRIVVAVCHLLGHPERPTRFIRGQRHVYCPCGRVDHTETWPLRREQEGAGDE